MFGGMQPLVMVIRELPPRFNVLSLPITVPVFTIPP
jgi:hypothetical protein